MALACTNSIVIPRKFGITLSVIGLITQLLNIITYGQWRIDIDIFGALIFIIGVVIMITGWKK